MNRSRANYHAMHTRKTARADKRQREQARDAKRLAKLAKHQADNPPKPISYDSLGGPDE